MPPNEPATPGTDRQCAACGAPQHEKLCIKLRATRVIEPLCLACFQSGSADDTERLILERRNSAPAPAFVPAVGDMCEGIPCKGSRFGGTGVQRGKFKHFDETNGEKQAMLELEGGVHCLVLRSSLKPAPATVEMWGSQPKDDELPETLPDGTAWKWSIGYRLFGVRKLSTMSYVVHHLEDLSGKTTHHFDPVRPEQWQVSPSEIDWTTVPRPSQKPVPAQACTGRVGSKPCQLRHRHEPPCMVEQGADLCACGADAKHVESADGDTFAVCDYCHDTRRSKPPDPWQSPPDPYAGYDLNAWGISSGSEREKRLERAREILTCTHQQAVCEDTCRLCGATGQERVAMTKRREAAGAFGKPLDRRISAARQSTEREAGVKRWDAWVSVRHARKP